MAPFPGLAAGSVTAVVWLYAVGLLADLIGAFVLFGPRWNYAAILEGWFVREGILAR